MCCIAKLAWAISWTFSQLKNSPLQWEDAYVFTFQDSAGAYKVHVDYPYGKQSTREQSVEYASTLHFYEAILRLKHDEAHLAQNILTLR